MKSKAFITKIVHGSKLKIGDHVLHYGQTEHTATSSWYTAPHGFVIREINESGFSAGPEGPVGHRFSANPAFWWFKIIDKGAEDLPGDYSL